MNTIKPLLLTVFSLMVCASSWGKNVFAHADSENIPALFSVTSGGTVGNLPQAKSDVVVRYLLNGKEVTESSNQMTFRALNKLVESSPRKLTGVKPNTSVTLTAGSSEKYAFSSIELVGATDQNPAAEVIDFKMPAENVTVTVNFKSLSDITMEYLCNDDPLETSSDAALIAELSPMVQVDKSNPVTFGDIVTLSKTAQFDDANYVLSWDVVTTFHRDRLTITDNQFTMADVDVSVKPNFRTKRDFSLEYLLNGQEVTETSNKAAYDVLKTLVETSLASFTDVVYNTKFTLTATTDNANYAFAKFDLSGVFDEDRYHSEIATISMPGNDYTVKVYFNTRIPSLDISESGYATLASPVAYTMPVGLQGGVVTVDKGVAIVDYKYQSGDAVPAGKALVVKGEKGMYELVQAKGDAIDHATVMKAALVDGIITPAAGCKLYILTTLNGKDLGFYLQNGHPQGDLQDVYGKGYLELSDADFDLTQSSQGLRLVEVGGTTGIDAVVAETENQDIYTLSGTRVSTEKENLPQGIYIVGGKKVVVK